MNKTLSHWIRSTLPQYFLTKVSTTRKSLTFWCNESPVIANPLLCTSPKIKSIICNTLKANSFISRVNVDWFFVENPIFLLIN